MISHIWSTYPFKEWISSLVHRIPSSRKEGTTYICVEEKHGQFSNVKKQIESTWSQMTWLTSQQPSKPNKKLINTSTSSFGCYQNFPVHQYSFSFLLEKVLKSSKTVLVLLSVLFSLFTSTETSFLKFALKKPYFQITTAQVFGIIQFLNWPRFYRLLHFHDGKHGQYSFQNCIQNLILPKNMIMLSLMLQM